MTINKLVTLLMGAQSIGMGNHVVRLNGTLIDYDFDNPELVDVVANEEEPYVYFDFQ